MMDVYGSVAAALIGLTFYGVHRISAFLLVGGAIVAGFVVLTYGGPALQLSADWLLMTAGLAAWVAGLAIVRVMLIRSASLQLLERIGGARPGSFRQDINERLADMRVLGLVRGTDRGNELTRAGGSVAGVVAVCYSAFRIRT
jgi:hypothetical protein